MRRPALCPFQCYCCCCFHKTVLPSMVGREAWDISQVHKWNFQTFDNNLVLFALVLTFCCFISGQPCNMEMIRTMIRYVAGSSDSQNFSASNVCALIERVLENEIWQGFSWSWEKRNAGSFEKGDTLQEFMGFFGNFDPRLRTKAKQNRKRPRIRSFLCGHEKHPSQISFSNSKTSWIRAQKWFPRN